MSSSQPHNTPCLLLSIQLSRPLVMSGVGRDHVTYAAGTFVFVFDSSNYASVLVTCLNGCSLHQLEYINFLSFSLALLNTFCYALSTSLFFY